MKLPTQYYYENVSENSRDVNPANRKYFYVYYQVAHQQNLVNGILGYFSDEMVKNYQLAKDLSNDNLKQLIKLNELDHLFVFRVK